MKSTGQWQSEINEETQKDEKMKTEAARRYVPQTRKDN